MTRRAQHCFIVIFHPIKISKEMETLLLAIHRFFIKQPKYIP